MRQELTSARCPKPDVRLRAHLGHSTVSFNFSKADKPGPQIVREMAVWQVERTTPARSSSVREWDDSLSRLENLDCHELSQRPIDRDMRMIWLRPAHQPHGIRRAS